MANFGLARLAEDVKRELTSIFRNVKDYRVKDAMVSIIRVELTSDLSYAKVFISSMSGIEETKLAAEGLKNAKGFIRKELNSRIQMRRSPELIFIADTSAEYSARINDKLNKIFEGNKAE
ncbi:MAG: 30S ribosome-binding factor RbfA [Oscillospiraceae bacterium]|nr:30S ribosome-binding factor RbfA [Oscillospiraceae bacterium]